MILNKVTNDAGTTFTALDPNDNNLVTALCVLSNGRILKSHEGIFASDDNGNTWVQKFNNSFGSFCVTHTGRIIGTTNGIKYSDDNGETWHAVSDMSGYFNKLCITPTGRILVSKDDKSDGFWYSDDNGEHWTHVSNGFAPFWVLSISSSELISGCAGNANGIWKSNDNGINWTKIYDGYANAACILPTGRIVVCFVTGIKYSDDNGVTWIASNVTSNNIECICRTTSGRLIAGGYYGIWKSDDNGENWTKVQSDDHKHWCEICVTETDRVLVGTGSGQGYNPNGLWYSDPVTSFQFPKYLDHKGARELVTQFKAYVDSLVENS